MEKEVQRLMPGDLNYALIKVASDASILDISGEVFPSRLKTVDSVMEYLSGMRKTSSTVMIQGAHGIGKSFVMKRVLNAYMEKFNVYPILYFTGTEECGIESLYQLFSVVAEELNFVKDSAVLARYESTEAEKDACLLKIVGELKAIFVDDADARSDHEIWTFLSNFVAKNKLTTRLLGSQSIEEDQKALATFHLEGLSSKELELCLKIFRSPKLTVTKQNLEAIIHAANGNPSLLQLYMKIENVLEMLEANLATGDPFNTVIKYLMNGMSTAELYVLSQIALCRRPIPWLQHTELQKIVDYGIIDLSISDGCTFVSIKNCIRRKVKRILPEFKVNVDDAVQASCSAFELWRCLLHPKLQELLLGAKERNWPYIPESWQFSDSVSDKEMYNLRDLLNNHNRHTGNKKMREIEVIQECLYHSLLDNDYESAAAVAFLIDRYAFWKGDSKSLLAIVEYIKRKSPSTPIAPQILTREARVLKNYGDLQGADRILDKLIGDEKNAGSWEYRDIDEFLIIKAASIELKGNIFHGLGLWLKAASCFMTSTRLFRSFKKRDKKGLAAGLAALADTLQYMPDEDFQEFSEEFQLDLKHRLLEAIRCVTEAANYCIYTPLFYCKNKRRAGEFSLAYAKVLEEEEMKLPCLENAAHEVRESLKCHTSINRLESREQFYEFVCCIFRISQICKKLFSTRESNATQIFEDLAKELFQHYCTYSQKVKHNTKSVALINKCMELLGLPIIPWIDDMKVGEEDLPTQKIIITKDADKANIIKLKEIGEQSTTVDAADNKSMMTIIQAPGKDGGKDETADKDQRVNHFSVFKIKSEATLLTADSTAEERPAANFITESHEDHLNPKPEQSFSEMVKSNVTSTMLKEYLSNEKTVSSVESMPINSIECSEGQNDKSNNEVAFREEDTWVSHETDSRPSGSMFRSSDTFVSYEGSGSLESNDTGYHSASTKSTADHDSLELESASNRPGNDWLACYTTADGETVEERSNRVKLTLNTLETAGANYQNDATKIETNKVHSALVWRYDPSTKQWSTMETLAFVGDKRDFGNKGGVCRDAYDFEHLNQDDPYGKYLGKQYKLERYRHNPRSIGQYKQDIICQNTARYYGTLFNQRLYDLLSGEAFGQIQFLPAVLVELTNVINDPQRYFNVEPFMFGNFEKITNNMDHVAEGDVSGKDLLLAFSHFSFHASKGELIVVDIQGWTSQDKRGFHYLTDPQIHTIDKCGYGTGNLGKRGMDNFWQKQHRSCNEICKALRLDSERPINLN